MSFCPIWSHAGSRKRGGGRVPPTCGPWYHGTVRRGRALPHLLSGLTRQHMALLCKHPLAKCQLRRTIGTIGASYSSWLGLV